MITLLEEGSTAGCVPVSLPPLPSTSLPVLPSLPRSFLYPIPQPSHPLPTYLLPSGSPTVLLSVVNTKHLARQDTVKYIATELDELEREEFVRLKKVQVRTRPQGVPNLAHR